MFNLTFRWPKLATRLESGPSSFSAVCLKFSSSSDTVQGSVSMPHYYRTLTDTGLVTGGQARMN